MKHYVYGLFTKNTDSPRLFYIGITSGDKNLYFRMKNHRRDKTNPYRFAIISKYDFDYRIFWGLNTRQEAEEREEFLIRWFRRCCDGGILCNLNKDAKDVSRARSRPKKDKSLWKKRCSGAGIASRDRQLAIPYVDIMELIEEWKQNPLESQQSFANRKGVTRENFKTWLKSYSPESVGLTKKLHLQIFESVYNDKDTHASMITKMMDNTGFSYSKAHGIFYKMLRKTKSR